MKANKHDIPSPSLGRARVGLVDRRTTPSESPPNLGEKEIDEISVDRLFGKNRWVFVLTKEFVFLCIVVLILTFSIPALSEEYRIVSLAPSITTMVDDLGMAPSLVGITQFCKKPETAVDAQVVGTLTSINYELLLTLRPTIVFTDDESNRSASIDRINSLGVKNVKLGPYKTVDDIMVAFQTIGDNLGKSREAEAYIENSKKRIQAISKAIAGCPRKKVFIEIWPKPLRTVSSEGYLHNLVSMAGGENVITGIPVPYPQVSMETVIAKKPDVILILTHSLIEDSRVGAYRQYPGFEHTLIQQLESSSITQPSLSASIQALDTLAGAIHPEAFESTP